MTESASGPGSLPTRERVIELRDFIHGRTYAAVALTITVDGEPPCAPESDLARVAEAGQALYQVTSHLCGRLLAELATGQPGPVAEALWQALISISQAWREDRDLPEGMGELMPVMPR